MAKTLRTMHKKGINGIMVSDCTATLNSFFQKKIEGEFNGKIVNHLECYD